MIRRADLERLLKLRRMRVDRAESAVTLQIRHCRAAEAEVEAALADLDEHEATEDERERQFFDAILNRPMPQKTLEQMRDRSLLLSYRHATLESNRRRALAKTTRSEAKLKELIVKQSELQRENNRLMEIAALLDKGEARTREALAELEADDDVALRRPNGRGC